ncbi:MAG: amino acid ABC transporter permease [Oligoflexales bacterium]
MKASLKKIWTLTKYRDLLFQGLVLLLLGFIAYIIIDNTIYNLKRQGIASGFDFLSQPSGFTVIQSLIDFTGDHSYGRAFFVGLLNTFLVSFLGIFFATIIGFLIGIARLAKNGIIKNLAAIYIETIRNIPLLLQIFIWYFVVLRSLPSPRESISWYDLVFLNNRGLYLPWLVDGAWSIPSLQGFNYSGGLVLIPEFTSLLTALSIYTGAFIAEIVRAGIQAVSKGQIEAASALGLNFIQSLRYIVIPQAFRIIVPPLTNQYLNLTKNSSLAAAIGYPDLVSVFAGTVLNQTGQAVEVIILTMLVYLSISLAIAFVMNQFNQRIKLKGHGS